MTFSSNQSSTLTELGQLVHSPLQSKNLQEGYIDEISLDYSFFPNTCNNEKSTQNSPQILLINGTMSVLIKHQHLQDNVLTVESNA